MIVILSFEYYIYSNIFQYQLVYIIITKLINCNINFIVHDGKHPYSHRYLLEFKIRKMYTHDRLQYYIQNIYYLLLCTIVLTAVCYAQAVAIGKFEFVEFAPAGLSV